MPSDTVIDKWLGEPIKAAVLPTSIFLTNKKGFPVLSKAHQRIIFSLFKVSQQTSFRLADNVAIKCIFLFLAGDPVHLHGNQPPLREGLQILPAVSGIPQPKPAGSQCLRALCQRLRRLPAVSATGEDAVLLQTTNTVVEATLTF